MPKANSISQIDLLRSTYPLLAVGLVIFLTVLIYVAKVAGKAVKQMGYKG